MSWLPQNRSQRIAGGIALLALILSLLVFLPIVSWLWILITGPLALFAGYGAFAAERRTSWQDWIVEHVVGITAVVAMWAILAALALWAVVNFKRAPLYEQRQPVVVLDKGDVRVTAVVPGGVLADGKTKPVTVWIDNGTAVTQTVTTTLQLPSNNPVTLLSPKRLITEVGPRRTVTGTLLLANGKDGEFPQGAMEEVEVGITAVVNGERGGATTTLQAEGNGGARLRRFVTATVDKTSPLIVVIAFLVPALGTLMQRYVDQYKEERLKQKQEHAEQLYKNIRQHLRVGEIKQAEEEWRIQENSKVLQELFPNEVNIIQNLLALATLAKPEEIKSQILNGRSWPNACISVFIIAWEKCRQQQVADGCNKALQDARHLLPVSAAMPDLQDNLALIALEIIARVKEKGEFAPIKEWPVPPQHPIPSTLAFPWVRETIPGGRDPFSHEKAEQDLFNLFRGRKDIAFWGGHSLFNRLFTIDQPMLVTGAVGSGRTALAHALHYYAPRREVLALHIPGTPTPSVLHRRFTAYLLEFVLRYPQNLRFSTGSNRVLLANLLVGTFGKTAVNARIENQQADLYTLLNPVPQEKKGIRGEQLQLLGKAVNDTSSSVQIMHWVGAVSTVVQALQFKRTLLVLDAPAKSEAWIQEMILPELTNWEIDGLTTILFLPDAIVEKLSYAGQEFRRRSLVWDRDSFYKMLQWRYKAFAGSRVVLEQHFTSNALNEMIEHCSVEDSGYNPRRFMQLWQMIVSEMPPDEDAQIGSDEIRGASQEIKGPAVMEISPETYPARDREEITMEETAVSRHPDPVSLRKILDNYFSRSELRILCFDLRVDYDDFPSTKMEMALEMVSYFERHDRLDELWGEICRRRPNLCEDDG